MVMGVVILTTKETLIYEKVVLTEAMVFCYLKKNKKGVYHELSEPYQPAEGEETPLPGHPGQPAMFTVRRNQLPLNDKSRLMCLRISHMNKILFIVGLCIALGAAALLFFDIIESGVAAMIGILGIGLIGASGISNIKRL